MTAVLPVPSACTQPGSALRSGGGQNTGTDDSDPGSCPFPVPNRLRPPKPRNPRNPMESNRLLRKSPHAKPVHVTDYLYRYYDPLTGRWTSPDPLGDEAFLMQYNAQKYFRDGSRVANDLLVSLYLMVANNPVNTFDLFGLAYFAYRPLGGVMGLLGVWDSKIGCW